MMHDAMDLSLYFMVGIWNTITTTDSPFMFVYGLGMLVGIISVVINITNVKKERGR